MDLKEFVAESLSQIVEGVTEAQQRIAEIGGAVSPAIASLSHNKRDGTLHDGRVVRLVEFDVAVSASSEDTTGAGAKLTVASIFSGGGEKRKQNVSESYSRIQFTVPIAYPPEERTTIEQQQKQLEKRRRQDEAMRSAGQAPGLYT